MKKDIYELSALPSQKSSLRRVLKTSDLFAIGYGDLGSSIYYALGITALYALGATPISLALAGLIFICTALTYAEMTSTFHESGGSASFARHAFNDFISFIAGWGLLLDYIVTIAISAFAVGPYLSFFYPDLKLTSVQIGFTIGLIVILYVLNFFGIRQSTRISFILAGFTIVTQAIIIIIGLVWLSDLPSIIEHMRINVPNMSWSPTWPEFWKGTAMAMVAYTGIESIAQLGAEAKTPSKTVPRAIVIAMLTLIFMYLGIAIVALSAMTPQQLGTDYVQDPIAGIALHLPFASKVLAPWIGILAALLLFVAANAGMVGASRLAFNMGEYYQIPRIFYRLHERFRTPFVSLAVFGGLAALVVLWSRGKLTFLADLYNFGAMLAFFSAHLSLIVMRIKRPDLVRPFKIALNIPFGKYSIPLTAIIGCLATAAVWVLIVITKPDGRYLGLAWMALGIAMYFLYRREKSIAAMGKIAIRKIKMPGYKPLLVKKILVPTRGDKETESIQAACEFAKLHGAQLTVIHIIDIPASMPLDAKLLHRTAFAQAVLNRAEAIARESDMTIDTHIIRARSVYQSVIDLVRKERFDLLVLGSEKGKGKVKQGLGHIAHKLIKEAPCRVWICSTDHM